MSENTIDNSVANSGMIPAEILAKWATDCPAKKEPAEFMKRKRSTYCFTNAELFKPFFLLVMERGEQQLPYKALAGCTPQTIHVKCCDALKWLCEQLPDNEAQKYQLLRLGYKISAEKDGVALRPRGTRIDLSMFVNAPQDVTLVNGVTALGQFVKPIVNEAKAGQIESNPKGSDQKTWKDIINDFVNDTTNEELMQEFRFEILTDDVREYVAQVFTGVSNKDFMFMPDNILRMIRMKV